VIDRVQVVALAVSVVLLVSVLELVRRRKMIEEYSFIWILFSLMLLALSARREILHVAARWLGVFYPPILLVMLLIVMFFVASLSHSVIVSRHRREIDRLTEETAILSAELRDLRADRSRTEAGREPTRVADSPSGVRPEPPAHVVAGAARDRPEPRR
jgi:hypothetical protein